MLVAHGTKDPAGLAALAEVRDAVGLRLGVPVSLSYVDVATPLLSDALAARPESLVVPLVEPLVVPLVVPLFMARGFHVEVDVPRAACEVGAPVTNHLGARAALAPALLARVHEVTRAPAGIVVLGAGSTRAAARAEILDTARALGTMAGGVPTWVGFLSGPGPSARDALNAAAEPGRPEPTKPVVAVPALLAPGHFARRAEAAAAQHGIPMATPLGAHDRVIDRIVALVEGTADYHHHVRAVEQCPGHSEP
jgi:sirohydrochlorin ferrochelatase